MNTKKRAGSKLKLDELLRAGASGRRPAVDIDKAISSTTHRLMKETITFTKQSARLDNSEPFRNSGFSMLESHNESSAMRRLAKLMAKEIPQDALNLSVRTKGVKKKPKFGKKKKPGGKFYTHVKTS